MSWYHDFDGGGLVPTWFPTRHILRALFLRQSRRLRYAMAGEDRFRPRARKRIDLQGRSAEKLGSPFELAVLTGERGALVNDAVRQSFSTPRWSRNRIATISSARITTARGFGGLLLRADSHFATNCLLHDYSRGARSEERALRASHAGNPSRRSKKIILGYPHRLKCAAGADSGRTAKATLPVARDNSNPSPAATASR